MAKLILYGKAREAAGVSVFYHDAGSLAELLAVARAEFGRGFVAVLDHSRVWVNGAVPAHGERTRIDGSDEVVVLPPVAGG